MTNIPGLFVAGEADYQYHGANRLGANSLLSCLYAGMVVGNSARAYMDSLKTGAGDAPQALYDGAAKAEQDDLARVSTMKGKENAFALWLQMGLEMNTHVTIVRYNDRLRATDAKLQEFQQRWAGIDVADTNKTWNTSVLFTKQLRDMLHLARCITLGALARDESRGAHYKPEFPARDDDKWLKTTKAAFTPDGPKFDYEPVDTGLLSLRARKYASA
jgi:succinate dehydrogenase / fumarate reductase flavoprotein subunit